MTSGMSSLLFFINIFD